MIERESLGVLNVEENNSYGQMRETKITIIDNEEVVGINISSAFKTHPTMGFSCSIVVKNAALCISVQNTLHNGTGQLLVPAISSSYHYFVPFRPTSRWMT